MASSHEAMDTDTDPRLARKRVARACDQCRRRKSRCDGLADCSACRSIGLSCSYGQVAKQARGPSYVAHPERTVDKLRDETKRLSAPSSSASRRPTSSQSPSSPEFSSSGDGISPASPAHLHHVPSLSHSSRETPSSHNSRFLESKVEYVETIAREPRAKAFGVDVLRQLTNFCYDLPRPGGSHRQDSAIKIVHALDAPFPLDHFPAGGPGVPPLPPTDVMLIWIELAFSEALPLWQFVDKQYLESILGRMWSTSPDFGQDESDKDDLALLYAVLALGQRSEICENGMYERKMQGLAYFAAARDAVPLASCERSIPALQTVLCMALYLKASSSQTRFHAYISSAASAALRMGLHQQVSGYQQEEQVLRHKVWLAVEAMDVYAAGALGLPSSLASAEVHVESFGTATDESTLASVAHHKLMTTAQRCVSRVYGNRESQVASSMQSRVVTTASLWESSEELDTWGSNCHFFAENGVALPVGDVTAATMRQLAACTRIQLLLAYAHCHARLLLYTPLVHHLALPSTERTSEAYSYGTKCMWAAVAAVQIAEELQRRFQLSEAYFLTVDVLVNAILVLTTVELGSSDRELLREVMPSGRRARDMLQNLIPLSVKAAECWEALAPLYNKTGTAGSIRGQSATGQGVRKNVADIRDSFRNSAHFATAGGVDPTHIWTNESLYLAPDDRIVLS